MVQMQALSIPDYSLHGICQEFVMVIAKLLPNICMSGHHAALASSPMPYGASRHEHTPGCEPKHEYAMPIGTVLANISCDEMA